MSNYKNLINRIIDNAEVKKNEIVNRAKEEANKIIDSKIIDANKIKEQIIFKAHSDGEQLKNKIISKSESNIRKSRLNFRKQILDDLFMESLERLVKLDKIKLKKYIAYKLDNLDLEGEYVLIIPKTYNSYDFEDLISSNSYKFVITKIKPSDILKGGFILEREGTLINYSFEIIMEFVREEIEFEVSKILFD